MIFQALEELGLSNNTFVFFTRSVPDRHQPLSNNTSDNGPELYMTEAGSMNGKLEAGSAGPLYGGKVILPPPIILKSF